jgi:hypothetical protein
MLLSCLSHWLIMSALGQKQTLDGEPGMSALPPKADILRGGVYVR